jgi:two-component system, response regulator PdtaR
MKDKINILLVEDEVISAMLLQTMLQRVGYKISHHVTTGERAIISARHNQIDIILMDIRLSGKIDGIETALKIRSESDIPIIFITCYEDLVIRKRAEETNPLAYLIKPLDPEHLKSIIDKYFG